MLPAKRPAFKTRKNTAVPCILPVPVAPDGGDEDGVLEDLLRAHPVRQVQEHVVAHQEVEFDGRFRPGLRVDLVVLLMQFFEGHPGVAGALPADFDVRDFEGPVLELQVAHEEPVFAGGEVRSRFVGRHVGRDDEDLVEGQAGGSHLLVEVLHDVPVAEVRRVERSPENSNAHRVCPLWYSRLGPFACFCQCGALSGSFCPDSLARRTH